jgi:tRNA-splicing ligase RtcB
MSLINGTDLIDAGWQPGPEINQALEKAAEYEARGISDKKYLLKLLARDVPKSTPKLAARAQPAPLGEAIAATCELDEENIAKVRKTMDELLCMPRIIRGAIMPDACPVGGGPATIPVGGAIAVENAIIPAAHSADICCSMYATFFDAASSDVGTLLDHVMGSTRFGYGGRKPDDLVHHPVLDEDVWENKFLQGLENHARIHMADQGDGNHFAFLGKVRLDEAAIASLETAGHGEMAAQLRAHGVPFTSHVLVTHHGSRGLGAQLYKRGQKAAEKHTNKIAKKIPKAAAWLDFDTEVGEEYWRALQYVGRWTKANHQSIHARFLERCEGERVTEFGNEHNFVWRRGQHFLHGKGATPAWNDEAGNPLLGLIPLNMASPILMVLGRDNEDYLSFCPHGAGRNVSRTATLRPFKNKDGELDEARVAAAIAESTEGIDVRWFYGKSDLSESPIGYKSADQVKQQIQQFGLADIVAEIEPLGSIMAGDSGPAPWMRRKDELSPKQIRQIGHRAERRKTHQKLGHPDEWED